MNETATAWPLTWPEGRPRTPRGNRKVAPFGKRENTHRTRYDGTSYTTSDSKSLTIADARERLQRELDLLRATGVILSTNIELRLDGLPRSGRNAPEDPGVALYFKYKGTPTVLACDLFTTVADNIAAIASHIDGMRKAERHGVGSLEQMFRGFTALPSAASVNDWRRELDNPQTLAAAEATYHAKIKVAHPDIAGAASTARAAALNAAIEMARKAFA
ncbi:MAG: J domain-containing protein [Candidatus Eremiobacteraeota bacterium]|nr:J domain-containing protein [Candidatus Eremiobacteraeota bacterium]